MDVNIVEMRPADSGGTGLRSVAGIYPGRLKAKGGSFDPLLVSTSEVVSKPAAFHHPGGEVEFDDSGREAAAEAPVVFAARTSAAGRADVTVIADQDLFADPLQGKATSDLLVRLVRAYVEPTTPAAFEVGARLLAADPSAVASIEFVERSPGVEVEAAKNADTDPYSVAFVGPATRARARAEREGQWAIQRWIRLRRFEDRWLLDTGSVADVESPELLLRLLRAFVQAKLKAVPRSNAAADAASEGPPASLRVVMRDARGRTLVDIVLETRPGGLAVLHARHSQQRFTASMEFESDLDTFEKGLQPSRWKDADREIGLGDFGIVGKGDPQR